MNKDNFQVIDSIAIEHDGSYLDLHNNFDFSGLVYEQQQHRVTLKWSKSLGKWAEQENYRVLKLIFDSVSVFCIHPRSVGKPFSEDSCMDYIGYLHPDDIELMDGFLPPEQADDDYHMVLGFESGMVIKLYAESIKVIAS